MVTGMPQGGVISPLLANIYLYAFELHPDKTRVVDLRKGKEGFDFLSCRLHARMSGRMWERWTEAWFHDQGLHKLLDTIRYPKAA